MLLHLGSKPSVLSSYTLYREGGIARVHDRQLQGVALLPIFNADHGQGSFDW